MQHELAPPRAEVLDNPAAATVWNFTEQLSTPGQRQEAFREIVPVTPLLEVPTWALPTDLQESGHRALVKHDGRMPGGAYKLRGVTSALLEDGGRSNHVVVASTGNHAKTTALAGRALQYGHVTAYCPRDASPAKVYGIEALGAEINYRDSLPEAVASAIKHARQPGTVFVHPYDQASVIGGQGTASLEIADQLAAMGIQATDIIFPGGGGGNAAGNAVAAKLAMPGANFKISQYKNAAGIVAALQGKDFDLASFDAMCDGAAVPVPGDLPMQILSHPGLVSEADTVTAGQIGEAIAVLSNFIEVVEPAGALAFAKALKDMRADRQGAGVIVAEISGMNTTPAKTREFMIAAMNEGYISSAQASAVLSKAHLERQIYGPQQVMLRAIGDAATRNSRVWVSSGPRFRPHPQ